MINVGLFESDDQGDIFPKRGSRISVKVGKQYTAEEVLETALKKHSDNDQFFCSLDDYVLCYPDQKIVEFIPGTTERFTVEKYKEEFLSKPYSKMDLFLCNISVYGNCSNMKNSKSNASSNQIEKKVENNIMDNNRHAFIPEISDSLGLPPEDFLSSCSSSTTCLPNFEEPWFLGSSSSAGLPTQQELLLDLPSISTVSDSTKSADFTPSKDVQQHQQTDHKVCCPVCNQQFSIYFIEEHANECLERRSRQLFSKGVK